MKILIMCLLVFMSSIAVADSYPYYPSSATDQLIAEDMRYSRQQTQDYINQSNIDLGRQRMLQEEQYEANHKKIQQYHKDRCDAERFIDCER